MAKADASLGENVGCKVEGSIVTLTIDVSRASMKLSPSGKTKRVASTGGAKTLTINGVDVDINLNAYTR